MNLYPFKRSSLFDILKIKDCIVGFSLIYFFIFSRVSGKEIEKFTQDTFKEGITVDLREPIYSNGILSTEKGGVVSAPKLRIQAIKISYIKQLQTTCPVWKIEAEGDLIVEFGDYVFVGKKLVYDFQAKEGTIDDGKTTVEPWFFGGEKLELRSDGSYIIYNGYVTTSEKDIPDWGIYSQSVYIQKDRYIKAQDVRLKLFDYTVLWLPSLRANLESIFESPIRYRFRWGGRQGPRVGLTYEIFSWERWKTFFRFDYRLTKGPGAGIETHYKSLDSKTEFQSINYIAKDSSILKPHEKARYRLEGIFQKKMDQDKTHIFLSYDKISDRDMPSNYYDRYFDFDTSERTQLLIRREEKNWISNFYTRVRVNNFQTVKQELPTFEVNFKPFEIKKTGIIFDNWASASYLDFKYSNFLLNNTDYTSTRFQYFPTLYRPVKFNRFFTLTPEVGMVCILYGNQRKEKGSEVLLGKAAIDFRSQLYGYYGLIKHVIEPYAYYQYFSYPLSTPHQHYIFDLSDGWSRLNYLTFGLKNIFYAKRSPFRISRLFAADLYAFAFFDTSKIYQTIPRVYGQFTFFTIPTLKHVIDTAWNFEHCQIDYFNFRSEWTLNADFAISFEYRHRGPYSWRKVDQENFFLDVFHSEHRLRHSQLSDRRDTLLVHFFYRFHPNWACEFTSRQGWNRHREPSYLEYEFDVLTTIQTAWHLRFSFQHQEDDTRVAMFLNIGLRRPDQPDPLKRTYYYD